MKRARLKRGSGSWKRQRLDISSYKTRYIGDILGKARISEPLREALVELRDALKKRDMEKAYELSSVKSLISSDYSKPKKGNLFNEDSDYNEKLFGGRSVYSILDVMHHEIAFSQDKIPSGMMVFHSTGVVEQKGKPHGESLTLKRIKSELEFIEKSVG